MKHNTVTVEIKKIIFLDIDGVLCPLHYENALFKMWKASNGAIKSKDDFGKLFFFQNCEALKKIIDETGAKIVISSTWRKEGEIKMRDMWNHRNLSGEIIGITPNEEDLVNFGKFEFFDDVCRGHEIEHWIEINNFKGKYVIIDDTKDMLPSQKKYFILTNEHYGLTDEDANKAISILNKN